MQNRTFKVTIIEILRIDFAFCKDQSEFRNTYDCWDFSGQDEVTRGLQVGSVENLVGLEDIFGFYETWLG